MNGALEDGDNSHDQGNVALKYGLAVGFAILIVTILYHFLIANVILEKWRGVFGDQYGALNTLFSGFAFAGVIVALILQNHEIKLQRLASAIQERELRRSVDSQAKAIESSVAVQIFQLMGSKEVTESRATAFRLYELGVRYPENKKPHEIHDRLEKELCDAIRSAGPPYEILGQFVELGYLPGDHICLHNAGAIYKLWVISTPYVDTMRQDVRNGYSKYWECFEKRALRQKELLGID